MIWTIAKHVKHFFVCTSTTTKRKGSFNQIKGTLHARMISFIKVLGLGLAALQIFSKCLNSPPAMTQNSYDALFSEYLEATTTVGVESIKQGAAEVIEKQDGNQDTMVSVDGSWQCRRHCSHNNIVSAVSVVTGKVLDIPAISS